MGTYSFRKDLEKSKASVVEAAKRLEEAEFLDGLFFVKEVRDNSADLIIHNPWTEETKLVEVKEDFYCKKSGNVALEVECRGKPSGLAASLADYWMYKIHQPDSTVFWGLVPIQDLFRAIRDKVFLREVVGGDKGSSTRMYLFSLDDFKALCNEV